MEHEYFLAKHVCTRFCVHNGILLICVSHAFLDYASPDTTEYVSVYYTVFLLLVEFPDNDFQTKDEKISK